MSANREFKDSLFTMLFNNEERLLSLYNALSGDSLPPGTPVEIATLEDVLFNGRYNDIAFVVNGKIVILIEHQSTISENMPIRLLIYMARVYEKLIDNDTIYKRKLQRIPKPEFIVLYNGPDPYPDERTLSLSDAYMEAEDELAGFGGKLELDVRVVNINEGRNKKIVGKCGTLSGYAIFVAKVRANRKAGMDLDQAVKQAAKDCIDAGILADFLNSHASEVINMLSTEFNIERARKVWESEAREDGVEEGLQKGRKEGLKKGVDISVGIVSALVMKIPVEDIAKQYDISVSNVKQLQSALGQNPAMTGIKQ